jgi:GT2 family glycosyltransferase
MSTLRLKVSKNYLRQVKNSFSDNFDLIKYQVGIVKSKLIFPNSNEYFDNETKIMTEREKKEKYEEIINKNISSLDLWPFGDNYPLVSIIITNRNGLLGLKKLFTNFKENIQYPSYEILLIDNGLTDDSIIFLAELKESISLKIIKNLEDNSFSKNNNNAVKSAQGEYILLLNSSLEPTYGWLNQMVQTALKSEDTGVIGAKLVYSDFSNSVYKGNSFKVHQIGTAFNEEPDDSFSTYNMGEGLEPFDTDCNSEYLRASFSNSALLIKKEKYLEVKGLDEAYNNGYEDIDLCLKLQKRGYKNILSPHALFFHYESAKLKKNEFEGQIKNRKLFNQKWNQYLLENLLKDKLNNGKLLSLKPLKIAFIVSEYGKEASAGDYFTALEFGEALQKFGWTISFLSRKGPGYWYKIGNDVDVLISLLDIYDPRRIKCSNKSLIKIAWPRNWFDRWVSHPGFLGYNLVFAPSKTALEYIKEKSGQKPFLLPIATNPGKFNGKVSKQKKYTSDYCFTGSYWNDPRDIMETLDPEEIPFQFKLYGKNWDKIDKFKKYYQGFVNYSNLPEVYASTKIVIDDANRATKNYGAVNSRVYDAIAVGVLVLTNGEKGSKETFNGKLPVFRSKEELNHLITYYLSNEDERIRKVKELQNFVLESHTYHNRANTMKQILEQYIKDT